jgi:hypothetical protein
VGIPFTAFGSTGGKMLHDIFAASRKYQNTVSIVFSGFEVGQAVTYPAASIEKDYGYAKKHPLAEAYRRYSPPPHERPCWDLTSVLYAVYPDRGYFGLSKEGKVTVDEKGVTNFIALAGGKHRFLTLTREQAVRCREAFANLASQPPTR